MFEKLRQWGEVNLLFNVTIYDISVIYVTAHRCAGGLKKKLNLRSGSQRHRHFAGFFKEIAAELRPWHLEFLHILACLLTPPTSLHRFKWNLAGMLHHKSRSAFGEIIHVRQILVKLWALTLGIFTHFRLSSQLLLHPCMDLNEIWQGCCTTSAFGEIIHVRGILAELWFLTLSIFTHFSLSSHFLLHSCVDLNETL